MTLRGVGNAGTRGGPRGDVHVVFEVADDPRFERDGEDLYTEVLVTYPQLVLGADVERADGRRRTSRSTFPPARRAGRSFTCAGAGLPRVNGGGTGDLHVRVQLWTPERLTDEERAAHRATRRAAAGRAGRRSRQGLLGEDERSARRVTQSTPAGSRCASIPAAQSRGRRSPRCSTPARRACRRRATRCVTHVAERRDADALCARGARGESRRARRDGSRCPTSTGPSSGSRAFARRRSAR